MFLKAKIYLERKDYQNLKEIILKEPGILKYLNDEDKTFLINHAFLKQDKILLFTMFPYITHEFQEEVIKNYPLSILQQGSLQNRFGMKEIIKNHIDTFLNLALNKKGEGILYLLSKTIAKNPQEYIEGVEKIKEYLLKAQLNENLISIASFNCYYSKKLEDKIIESNHPKYIALFLENKSHEITISILKNYIEKCPKPEDLKELANRTQKQKEIMSIINGKEINQKLKSEYYLALYLTNPSKEISAILRDKIIKLNDFSSIKYLMKTLDQKAQNSIIEKYLKVEDESLIITLTCTTNCPKTYELIKEIINNHIVGITILMIYLKKEYLNYTLNSLIVAKKDSYLKIMDMCYKNNIKDNESNSIWLFMFDFIIANHLEKEFPKEIIERWQKRKKELNKGVTRKRFLTER